MRHSSRWRYGFLVAAVLLGGAGAAHAAPSAGDVAIVLDGKDANALGAVLDGIVPSTLKIASPIEVRKALAAERKPGRKKGPAAALMAKVQSRLGTPLLIYLTAEGPPRARKLRVLVIRAGSDPVEQVIPLPPKADAAKILDPIITPAFAPPVDKTAPPTVAPTTATTPGNKPPTSEGTLMTPPLDTADVRRSAGDRHDFKIVSLEVDAAVGGRRFHYDQVASDSLRPYAIGAVPMVSLAADFYPFAPTHKTFLQDLSIAGQFARSLYAQSAFQSGGATVSNTWTDWAAGLHARLRTGTPDMPIVGLSLLYGGLDFSFDNTGAISGLPSVRYQYIAPGLDVRWTPSRLSLFGTFAYRAVLEGGYSAARFTSSTVNGIDFFFGASLRLGAGFELRVTGEYSRFFYSVKSMAGDPAAAGDATDEYLVGRLGLLWAI